MKYTRLILPSKGTKKPISPNYLKRDIKDHNRSYTTQVSQISLEEKEPLVRVTLEPRDWVQSGDKGIPPMGPGSDMMRYFSQADDLNGLDGGPNFIKSIMGIGGTWWQLLAMRNIHPYTHFRNVLEATKKNKTPIEWLQRSTHLFGLEECSEPVIRETLGSLGEIAGNDRLLFGRLFHFNNLDMQKESTFSAVNTLRYRGASLGKGTPVTNIILSDEYSYARFIKPEEVGEGIIRGLKRSLALYGPDDKVPLQGGIKDFSGDLSPEIARKILRYTHYRIQEEAEKLEAEGKPAHAARLRSAIITMHNHLTDITQDTAQAWIETAFELGQRVTIHGINDVENATHLTLQRHILPHMKKGGIILNEAQDRLVDEMSGTLTRVLHSRRESIVQDYKPHTPRKGTGFAGGGKPMIMQYVTNISMLFKISMEEAEKLLHDEMAIVRDKNKIPPVTPAQKAIADAALLRLQNKASGKPPYDGNLSPELVDVIRNLLPEQAEEKDLLEAGYKQYRKQVVDEYVKQGAISKETAQEIFNVGMNKDKSSLDKEQTLGILQRANVKEDIVEAIIESCGHATRPTIFLDQLARASEVVKELKEKGEIKITDEREATLIIASLWGRDIGKTLVKHHGDPSKFPALGVVTSTNQPRIINVQDLVIRGINIAGDVLPEVHPIPYRTKDTIKTIIGKPLMDGILHHLEEIVSLEQRLSDRTRCYGEQRLRQSEILDQHKIELEKLEATAKNILKENVDNEVQQRVYEPDDTATALRIDTERFSEMLKEETLKLKKQQETMLPDSLTR